jgi:hypothetical protein
MLNKYTRQVAQFGVSSLPGYFVMDYLKPWKIHTKSIRKFGHSTVDSMVFVMVLRRLYLHCITHSFAFSYYLQPQITCKDHFTIAAETAAQASALFMLNTSLEYNVKKLVYDKYGINLFYN